MNLKAVLLISLSIIYKLKILTISLKNSIIVKQQSHFSRNWTGILFQKWSGKLGTSLEIWNWWISRATLYSLQCLEVIFSFLHFTTSCLKNYTFLKLASWNLSVFSVPIIFAHRIREIFTWNIKRKLTALNERKWILHSTSSKLIFRKRRGSREVAAWPASRGLRRLKLPKFLLHSKQIRSLPLSRKLDFFDGLPSLSRSHIILWGTFSSGQKGTINRRHSAKLGTHYASSGMGKLPE